MSSEQEIQQENEKLKKDLQAKTKKFDKIKKDYSELETFHLQLTDYSQSQTDNIEKLDQEINNYQTIIEAKEFELKRLQGDYSKLENMSIMSGCSGFTRKTNTTNAKSMAKKPTRGWFSKNKVELTALETERDEQMAELETVLAENDQTREKFDRINSNFIKVSCQLQDSCAEIDEFKQEITKLKEENTKFEKRYEKANSDRQAQKEKSEKLKFELQAINETLDKVKTNEKKARDEQMDRIVDLKAENYILNEKNTQVQDEIEQSQNEVMDLNLNIESLKSTIIKKDEEIQEFAVSSANYIEEYKRDYNLYTEKIDELKQEINENEATIQEANQQLKDNEEKHDLEQETMIKSYEKRVEGESNTNELMSEEMKLLKERVQDTEKSYHQIKSSFDEINEKYQDEKSIKGELELVQELTQREASDTLQDLQMQQEEIKTMKNEVQEYKKESSNLKHLNSDLSSQLETFMTTKDEFKKLGVIKNDLETQNLDLYSQISTLKQKNVESLKMYVKIQDDYKNDLESLRAEINRTKEDKKSLNSRVENFTNTNSTLQKNNDSLRIEVDGIEVKLRLKTEEVQKEKVTTQKKTDALEKKISEFERYKKKNTEKVENLEKNVETLEDDLYKATKDNTDYTERLENQKIEISVQHSEINKQKNETVKAIEKSKNQSIEIASKNTDNELVDELTNKINKLYAEVRVYKNLLKTNQNDTKTPNTKTPNKDSDPNRNTISYTHTQTKSTFNIDTNEKLYQNNEKYNQLFPQQVKNQSNKQSTEHTKKYPSQISPQHIKSYSNIQKHNYLKDNISQNEKSDNYRDLDNLRKSYYISTCKDPNESFTTIDDDSSTKVNQFRQKNKLLINESSDFDEITRINKSMLLPASNHNFNYSMTEREGYDYANDQNYIPNKNHKKSYADKVNRMKIAERQSISKKIDCDVSNSISDFKEYDKKCVEIKKIYANNEKFPNITNFDNFQNKNDPKLQSTKNVIRNYGNNNLTPKNDFFNNLTTKDMDKHYHSHKKN